MDNLVLAAIIIKVPLCEVPGMEKISMISCGGYHTTCVDENGSLWTFGYNRNGQLGLGDTENRNKANEVPDITNVKSLSKGCITDSCIVQCDDNSLWVFGLNNCGQLGLNNTTNQVSPQRMDEQWEQMVGSGRNWQRGKSARNTK